MERFAIRKNFRRDIPSGRRTAQSAPFVIAAAVFTLLRLALCGGLWIHFVPDTGYDDIMQITKALSITNGEWLGAYDSMTLVKGAGYPVITALFHALKVPYILGWNLIAVLACAVFVWAVAPLVRSRAALLLCYLFLLFNPISFDSDVNRYYRDIGYYALAFLAAALFCAFLVRQKVWIAACAGFALAAAAVTREDSQWLYLYAAGCMTAVLLLRFIDRQKAVRLLGQSILAVLCGYAVLCVPLSWMNYSRYGTFALDEYNSGSYAAAYGALSRLDGGLEDAHITIPESERMLLYQNSEAFAELYPYLDAPDARYAGWKEVQGEYRTGYFSFVLRSAAQQAGKYASAQEADAYFTQLAQEVNAYCEEHPSGPPRRTIVGRFYPKDLPAMAASWGRGIWTAVRYSALSAIPVPASADDTYLQTFESYTGSVCAANRDMEDGSVVENYHPAGMRLWMQRGCRVLIIAYQLVTPVLFVAACVCWILWGISVFRPWNAGRRTLCLWIAQSSLFCLFLVREAMLAYVDVTAFPTIGYPPYQAASYPVMLGFIALVLCPVLSQLLCRKSAAEDEPKIFLLDRKEH